MSNGKRAESIEWGFGYPCESFTGNLDNLFGKGDRVGGQFFDTTGKRGNTGQFLNQGVYLFVRFELLWWKGRFFGGERCSDTTKRKILVLF